ncbi:hypothetical protein KY289_001187 [Solanum tuberosum]|nr:hypothetical protein KY289_001187 [Solanum tuberosum]
MVHLPIHLATEAKIAGPIHYRWMYHVERWLYFLKSLIGNRACPEGCIAEGYIANECMTLCSSQPGRTLGAKDTCELEADELEQAHLYILKNCDEVIPYLKEFAQTHENAQHLSDAEWSLQFIEWFKDRVAQLHKGDASRIMEDLFSLSLGPTKYSTRSMDMSNQASQVFYANDNSNKRWKVVRKTQSRDSYEIVEQMDDDLVELGSPSQKKRKTTNEVKFKMKPLKIENEVGSNMKSTIRYIFVAPGAIGKGRGQGHKSMGEKGKTPSKSLLPQSSDLVKKEQGHKKSTMFTSQGMQTIHKNSMVHEKENLKINIPFSTSAIQVEKYTQEVETMDPTAIGKGLKQKSGSLSSSLEISEYDMGSFNKSDVCANQHMQTPSESTKSGSSNPTKGGKDGNLSDLVTIFFETRKKDNKLVEPEVIEKHAQLEEMVQEDLSLPTIEIVEKCCGPQTHSHVFEFGGGVKAKDLKGGTSSKAELLSALRSTREDIKSLNEESKSLNEENKSLNDRMSTIENEMKEIMKLKELFAAQQSHVTITSSVSTE